MENLVKMRRPDGVVVEVNKNDVSKYLKKKGWSLASSSEMRYNLRIPLSKKDEKIYEDLYNEIGRNENSIDGLDKVLAKIENADLPKEAIDSLKGSIKYRKKKIEKPIKEREEKKVTLTEDQAVTSMKKRVKELEKEVDGLRKRRGSGQKDVNVKLTNLQRDDTVDVMADQTDEDDAQIGELEYEIKTLKDDLKLIQQQGYARFLTIKEKVAAKTNRMYI